MGLSYCPKTGKVQNRSRFYSTRRRHSPGMAFSFYAGLMLFMASSVTGQSSLLDRPVTIPKHNTTLYEALNLISQSAGCLFIYDSETLENDRHVRLHADHLALNKVLDGLLSDPSLSYRVIGMHILIYRMKKEPPPGNIGKPTVPGIDIIKNIVVRGHVYDRENRAPIPCATVGIAAHNTGTVTNSDGFFLLKIPDSLAGSSLVVSHLGFTNRTIPVQLISGQQADLYLERRVISIQEVIIRYIDPERIIEKAMERRKENYAVEPAYLTTFYREGVQKNNRYASYSEAVFKVYKSPFDEGERSDQVKLLKSRKIRDTVANDTVFLKLKAGVQSALQLDIVKCVAGFLDLSPPAEYTYRYSDLVSYNSRDAYAITFVQKPGLGKALYTGTLYIEKEGFAILGADFEINPSYLDLAGEDLVLKKSPRLIVQLSKITYSVSYMPYNGRYYLNHVRCDLQVATRLRNHLSSDHFTTFLELATCNIDTMGVVKFPKQEILKPGVVFSDQLFGSNDAFWGGLNIIAPEAKLGEALSRIIGKIEEIR